MFKIPGSVSIRVVPPFPMIIIIIILIIIHMVLFFFYQSTLMVYCIAFLNPFFLEW